MFSKTMYILIGDDRTGKTSFQKYVIKHLCLEKVGKLEVNKDFDVRHPKAPSYFTKISFMNRSFQEKLTDHSKEGPKSKNSYDSMDDFFENHFNAQDVCVLSSHLNRFHIEQMIEEGHKRFYNVVGVFFENSIAANTKWLQDISHEFAWDERIVIENPVVKNNNETIISQQLEAAAKKFTRMLIHRSKLN